MTRFHPKPALTALALILATTGYGWAQEGAPAETPVQQAPAGDDFDMAGDPQPDLDAVASDPVVPADAGPDTPVADAAPDVVPDAPSDPAPTPADAAPADAPPAAPAQVAMPATPEGWTEYTHFGVRFALPPGFTLDDLENEMRDGLLAGFTNVDAADHGAAYSVGFVPLDEVLAMPMGIRQEFGEDAVRETPDPVVIGPFSFTEYRGDNLVQGELNLSFRIYVGTEPMETGLVPAVMMIYNTVDPADWAEPEQQFRNSIVYSDDPALLGMPDAEPYRDGIFSLRLLPGWQSSGGISPEFNWITLRESGMKVARIVLADIGTHDWSMESYLRDNYAGELTIREGEFQGVPVWFVEGRAVRDLDANRTADGAPWLRQGMFTQLCVPERGPVAAELITLDMAREAGVTPDAVFASLQVSLPETATPCPASVAEAIAAASGATVPTVEPPAADAPDVPPMAEDLPMPGDDAPDVPAILDMPDPVPVDDAPVVQTPPPAAVDPDGKPDQVVAPPVTPTPTVDPDARAWAEAERTQSVAAMLAYIQDWPRGAHAAEARAWLAARAVMVPEPTPAAPTPVQPNIAHPQEMAAWQEAMRLGTSAALWDYLKAWPDGVFVQEAWIELDLRRGGPTVPSPAPAPAPMPQGGK